MRFGWRGFLAVAVDDAIRRLLPRHERTGRPVGDGAFVTRIERCLHWTVRKKEMVDVGTSTLRDFAGMAEGGWDGYRAVGQPHGLPVRIGDGVFAAAAT